MPMAYSTGSVSGVMGKGSETRRLKGYPYPFSPWQEAHFWA